MSVHWIQFVTQGQRVNGCSWRYAQESCLICCCNVIHLVAFSFVLLHHLDSFKYVQFEWWRAVVSFVIRVRNPRFCSKCTTVDYDCVMIDLMLPRLNGEIVWCASTKLPSAALVVKSDILWCLWVWMFVSWVFCCVVARPHCGESVQIWSFFTQSVRWHDHSSRLWVAVRLAEKFAAKDSATVKPFYHHFSQWQYSGSGIQMCVCICVIYVGMHCVALYVDGVKMNTVYMTVHLVTEQCCICYINTTETTDHSLAGLSPYGYHRYLNDSFCFQLLPFVIRNRSMLAQFLARAQ